MDLAHAGDQLAELSNLADMFHVDIMDGHFAPNLALSPDWVKKLAPYATVPLEAHLMTEQPQRWIDSLAEAGVSVISPHAETLRQNAFRVMAEIAGHGCKTGLALSPLTPLAEVKHVLPRVDLLTLMTVDIGFVGQPFITEMLNKIDEAAEFRARENLGYSIQIDGSCSPATFGQLRQAGADIFILGNAGLFSLSPNLTHAWQLMRQAYQQATNEPAPRKGSHD
jgi:D-allulose-6-phosphate 3-epimerase